MDWFEHSRRYTNHPAGAHADGPLPVAVSEARLAVEGQSLQLCRLQASGTLESSVTAGSQAHVCADAS